jgi:hypothetical protein
VGRVRKQASTRRVTTLSILSDAEFRRGFEEARLGKPFDPNNNDWDYERGRLFARIAPLDMPLWIDLPLVSGRKIGQKLNPKALALAEAAFARRLLI